MTKQQRPRNPESYNCANPKCPRGTPLPLHLHYTAALPSHHPTRVHYVEEAGMIGFSIFCPSCRHYTIVNLVRAGEGAARGGGPS
jgi:hypothetical protein